MSERLPINKVESFDKFNKKRRRPDRRGHMRNCGFSLARIIEKYSDERKPSVIVSEYLNALSREAGGYRHAVLLPYKDTLGYMYYEAWIKELNR